jgi:hypothetical protein
MLKAQLISDVKFGIGIIKSV